jgi:HEAT repeat protein
MTVTMQDVRRILDPEEPRYDRIPALGPEALPHLRELAAGEDPMLASKAVFAASMLEGATGATVVDAGAHHDDPIVRVAAAAAAQNLPADDARGVLRDLVGDDDSGVRKVALASADRAG